MLESNCWTVRDRQLNTLNPDKQVGFSDSILPSPSFCGPRSMRKESESIK